MKYVLMYTSRPEDDATLDPADAEAVYGEIFGWFERNAAVITDMGAELQAVDLGHHRARRGRVGRRRRPFQRGEGGHRWV